jgi:hypothetical protein
MRERGSGAAWSSVLNDRANALSEREREAALEAELVDVGDAEWGSVLSTLGQIARTAPAALPSVIQGAQKGAIAGPGGAVAGAVTGAVTHYVARGARPAPSTTTPAPVAAALVAPAPVARPPAPPIAALPIAPAPVVAVASTPASTAPALPAPLTTSGTSAAARLLRLLQDPRFLQACAALVPGQLGLREIQVNGAAAPPAAFLNLLAVLALEAAQQAPAPDSPVDGYLRGPDGAYAVDVASPSARARALLERLESGMAAPAATSAPGARASAEAWLLESGMAELVSP